MTVKLKDEGEKIVMIGKDTITSENLTWEKYEALMKSFPELKAKFIEIEEHEVKVKKVS